MFRGFAPQHQLCVGVCRPIPAVGRMGDRIVVAGGYDDIRLELAQRLNYAFAGRTAPVEGEEGEWKALHRPNPRMGVAVGSLQNAQTEHARVSREGAHSGEMIRAHRAPMPHNVRDAVGYPTHLSSTNRNMLI